ncbi:hypothetical protein HD597_006982 [Nonomuraea thailandensis]|uniref:Deoxyribonuclease NucA/NucB domain-containing protein n=1 Tax=Nonomuraea thailandensis TaxID=1188745 RepID=A0A9X2K3Y4_9ACTN|nr:NucA/NucB deoxyribonuclease domain-containing protein [Nonomuraea thailandensis]MCP2359962.1 hypothetical protein [Nonomuraea thailandensis]
MMYDWKVTTTKGQNGTTQKKTASPTVDGQLHFDATVVIHTYLGNRSGTGIIGGGQHPRDIKVFTKIDDLDGGADDGALGWFECLLTGCDGKFDDDDLDRVLSLQVDVQGGTNACTLTSGSGYNNSLKRSNSISQWVADGRDEFLLRSQAARVSSCTVRPWITFDDPTPHTGKKQSVALWGPPGAVSGATSESMAKRANSPVMMCDSLPMWENTGACIIKGTSRIYKMYTHDPDIGAVPQHIHQAWTNPASTVPLKAGKIVPGQWGYAANGQPRETPAREALHRITTEVNGRPTETYAANLAAKNAVCDEFFDDRPRPKNGVTDEDKVEDCDEFPFASSKEGGAYVHENNGWGNFSVKAINAKQNQLAGSELNIFFSRYRVRSGDPYWLLIN